jgi:hypothetical protein
VLVKGLQVTTVPLFRETILSLEHITVPPLQVTMLSSPKGLHVTGSEEYVQLTVEFIAEHYTGS